MWSPSDSDCDEQPVDMIQMAAAANRADESDNDGESDSTYTHDNHRDERSLGPDREDDVGSSDEDDNTHRSTIKHRALTYDPVSKEPSSEIQLYKHTDDQVRKEGKELQLFGIPIPGTSSSITPIGGSVETGSGEITTFLPEKILKGSLKTCPEDGREVHVHMHKTEIKATAVTIGGKVVLGKEGETEKPSSTEHVQSRPNQVLSLRKVTEKHIEDWTKGMIHTAATKMIVKKIQDGKSWVIVTGGPGEGKTTAAYLALKQLQDMGRQVYEIPTQEDYFKVKETKGPIIMLNDILGLCQFNMSNLEAWRPVLNDMFELKEHRYGELKQHGGGSVHSERQKHICVILVSRSSVLIAAADNLDKLKCAFFNDECVINLDMKCSLKERLDIWRYHAKNYKVDIDEKIVRCALQMPLSSGFPSYCRTFAKMYSKNSTLSMESFFLKPIEFLNQNIQSVLHEPAGGLLLRKILEHGQLVLDNVLDDEQRYQFKKVVKRYRGIYLSENDGTVMFRHSSVYDTVALLVGKKDVLFVIKYCTLSFLNERVRFQNPGHQNYADTLLTVPNTPTNTAKYIERLKTEISHGNVSLALSHVSFHSEEFVEKFMKILHASCQDLPEFDFIQELIKKQDKTSGHSFLFHSTISKSKNVLKYICNLLNLSLEEQTDALFGICEQSSISSLEFLLCKYKHIHLNERNSTDETPLLVASKKASSEILKMLLTKGADVTAVDKEGNSVLSNICVNGIDGDGSVVEMLLGENDDFRPHMDEYIHISAKNGHTNVVTALTSSGADINRVDIDGKTPLHHACGGGYVEIVTSLVNKGVDIFKTDNNGMTAFHYACLGGNVEIMAVLLDKKMDVNTPDSNGRTPCHYACKGGHVHVLMALIELGVDVTKTDSRGTTPFHFACAGGHVEVMKALMDRGVDVSKIGSDGKTLYEAACEGGHADAVAFLKDSDIQNSKSDCSHRRTYDSACGGGHVDSVSSLGDSGVEINKLVINHRTTSDRACGGRLVDVSSSGNSGVEINKLNIGYRTTSDSSCGGGLVDMSGLGDSGVEINKSNIGYRTTSNSACGGGLVDMSSLGDSGVEINKSDISDSPASDRACGGGLVDVLSLGDSGVEINKSHISDRSSPDSACGGGFFDMSSLGNSGVEIKKSDISDSPTSDRACGGALVDMSSLGDSGVEIKKSDISDSPTSDRACGGGYVDLGDSGVEINTLDIGDRTISDVTCDRTSNNVRAREHVEVIYSRLW